MIISKDLISFRGTEYGYKYGNNYNDFYRGCTVYMIDSKGNKVKMNLNSNAGFKSRGKYSREQYKPFVNFLKKAQGNVRINIIGNSARTSHSFNFNATGFIKNYKKMLKKNKGLK